VHHLATIVEVLGNAQNVKEEEKLTKHHQVGWIKKETPFTITKMNVIYV